MIFAGLEIIDYCRCCGRSKDACRAAAEPLAVGGVDHGICLRCIRMIDRQSDRTLAAFATQDLDAPHNAWLRRFNFSRQLRQAAERRSPFVKRGAS
jgi:hypothetical protein